MCTYGPMFIHLSAILDHIGFVAKQEGRTEVARTRRRCDICQFRGSDGFMISTRLLIKPLRQMLPFIWLIVTRDAWCYSIVIFTVVPVWCFAKNNKGVIGINTNKPRLTSTSRLLLERLATSNRSYRPFAH